MPLSWLYVPQLKTCSLTVANDPWHRQEKVTAQQNVNVLYDRNRRLVSSGVHLKYTTVPGHAVSWTRLPE